MERIRREVIKKSGVHQASNKNICAPSECKGRQIYILSSFDLVRALEIHDVAHACLMNSMRTSNGHEHP